MKHNLKEFITRVLINESNIDDDKITQRIIDKFPYDFSRLGGVQFFNSTSAVSGACSQDKKQDFLKRWSRDTYLRELFLKTWVRSTKGNVFDFCLIPNEFRQYIHSNMQNAEMFITTNGHRYPVSIKQVSRALGLADTVDEFKQMIKLEVGIE